MRVERSTPSTKLRKYRAKRDFTKTREPSGKTAVKPSNRLRFVIQKHAATRLHYDLRLELDGVFKSWAVTRGPSLDPHDKRLAVEVEDHPLDYGDFEGTIPQGQYGGGTVQMWDRGYWENESARSPQEALEKGDIKFRLDGKKLNGSWALVRMRRREHEKRDNWLLIKHRDEYAVDGNGDAVLAEDKSVASGRTMAQIEAGKGRAPRPFMLKADGPADAVWQSDRAFDAEPAAAKVAARAEKPIAGKPAAHMPEFVEPQLARLVDRPPVGSGWGHEVKFDGYRMQMRVVRHKAVLRTRKGLDWTEKFKPVAKDGASLPDCIIDGELVALDSKGQPNFAALQAALGDGEEADLVYYVFDLMFADRQDWRHLPLRARKERLETLLDKAGKRLRFVNHVEAPGDAVLEAAEKMGLEGIISKRLDAPYRSGRAGTWLKTKIRGGQEIVIGGWTEEDGRFRSLLAGAYKDGRFVYMGRVGTGFGRSNIPELFPKLKAAASEVSPFTGPTAPKRERGVHWARPLLVAEVESAGMTAEGLLRQTAFKALREDKDAKDVVVEMPAHIPSPSAKPAVHAPAKVFRSQANKQVLGVTISHPDKVLWPEAGDSDAVTKLDLAAYYESMGDFILDYIGGRPCSIIRAPDGIGEQLFFQRHSMKGASDLLTFVKVTGEKEPYLQIDTIEALIAAAQIAAVELHPWNNEPGDPETPGRLVFDLDPGPDVAFDDITYAAREMRDRLSELGLESFCKTTGGKGLHVVTPFAPSRTELRWPEAKAFAQEVCRQMAADSPDRYLISMKKTERGGRIYLDYLRNDRTATAVSLLSPRARPGAPVSMPIAWTQVKAGLDPKRFTLWTAPALMKKSKAWAGYAKAARPFAAAARKLRGAR